MSPGDSSTLGQRARLPRAKCSVFSPPSALWPIKLGKAPRKSTNNGRAHAFGTLFVAFIRDLPEEILTPEAGSIDAFFAGLLFQRIEMSQTEYKATRLGNQLELVTPGVAATHLF